jgi:GNAT superfamily N-acetyltransferase
MDLQARHSSGALLPDLPAGFSSRHFRDDDDIVAMRAVHAACLMHDKTDVHSVCDTLPHLSIEAYREHLKNVAPGDNRLIVEQAGAVVAHAFMDVWGHEERMYLWRVWVVPPCRNLGLGTSMIRWGESRARVLHGSDPRVGFHLANATEVEADAVTLLRHEGYHLSFISPELAFDDFQHLGDMPATRGIAFQFFDTSQHRIVARALCEANLNPPEQESRFTGFDLERRIDLEEKEWLDRVANADSALSPVAWAAGTVAGAYLCRANGVVGEISQVAVRSGWRGQGIARALSLLSLRGLRDAGCTTARLFTSKTPDEIEPARGPYAMYRKFGFKPISRHLRFRKPMAR